MKPDAVKEAIIRLNEGQIGVIATDTIYGIVATINEPQVIEKIYSVTNRPLNKPFIILVSNIEQILSLGISLSNAQNAALKKLWPGPNSVILPAYTNELRYLHRGVKSLAFRLPQPEWLQELVSATGPIVATSANKSGKQTPSDIDVVQEELPGLDFYFGGEVASLPSKIFTLNNGGETTELKRS